MTTSASVTYLTRQFDDFLFARIDEGSNATPLSVLSMLARLDVDPWDEAAKLARLPRAAAARRLVDFIAATPGAPSAYLNAKTVCDRLLNLLPSPVSAGSPGTGDARNKESPVGLAGRNCHYYSGDLTDRDAHLQESCRRVKRSQRHPGCFLGPRSEPSSAPAMR